MQDFDFYADRPVQLDAVLIELDDRPAKELFYLPALCLLGLIVFIQRRRFIAAGIKQG